MCSYSAGKIIPLEFEDVCTCPRVEHGLEEAVHFPCSLTFDYCASLQSLKKTIEQVALTNKLYPTTIFLTSTYCPLYNKVLRNISFPGFHYLDGGIFISTLLSETVTCRPGICSVFQTLFAFEGSEFHLERCDVKRNRLWKAVDSIESECFDRVGFHLVWHLQSVRNLR